MTRASRFRSRIPSSVRFLGALALALALSAGGCLRDSENSGDVTLTATARRGGFRTTLSSVGEIEAERSLQITAPFSGKIVKLAPEGSYVEKGDPVVWFETTEFEEQAEDLRVEVKLAEADYRQEQEDFELLKAKQELAVKSEEAKVRYQELAFENARVEYENQKALVDKNLAARSTLDDKRLSMLQAELSLKEAQVALRKIKSNQQSDLRIKQAEIDKALVRLEKQKKRLEDLERKIESATLVAEGPGYINYMNAWRGIRRGKIAEGDSVWHRYPLIAIPDPTTLMAEIAINEIDIARVQPGQKATVRIDALPDREFAGSVAKKAQTPLSEDQRSASRSEGVKEFAVLVKLNELDPEMRQGMTARVEIVVDEVANALIAPIESVFEDEQGHFCYVEGADGFKRRAVEVGSSNSRFAAITKGLDEGDRLALRPPDAS